MDYKGTLNLPKTSFPMKANLSQREPERLNRWDEINAYDKIMQSRKESERYVLHDGPPYANGHIHIGHALNKILKDFVVKLKTFEGFQTPYVPGWDCHGLPIEHQVDKKLGKKKHDMTKAEIRKQCRDYAMKFIDIQRDEFKRFGGFGDWENPYVTMDYVYEAKTLEELYRFFENGGVYKGSKPVYWCTSCVTALAEAEVEYDDHTSISVYVKFKADEKLAEMLGTPASVVIWTTTPWTLPANLGVAVHPDFNYSLIKVKETENGNLEAGEHILIAEDLAEKMTAEFRITDYETVKIYKGTELENFKAKHPFYDRESLIILGDHVTLEQGTGLVHTAPGHGQEDYAVGREYGLEVYNPVDDYGKFKNDVELFGGEHINKANPRIVEHMQENGSLLSSGEIHHSYPHCWRCKKPVIFRATPQWFISMETNDLRKKALEEINRVQWYPAWGQNRITSMIENRPDWCISRQRTWGVPIAVFLCEQCEEIHLPEDIRRKVLEEFRLNGADVWFEKEVEEFIPAGTKCSKCGHDKFKKETDILDVWFDSGVSHSAVCEEREELGWPVNMYLEGSDQHRGWFHSTLLESVGTRGRAPYDEILTHGFVVDGKGRKMSKSSGNVVAPDEIIKKYGAEVLRLWVSAEDYSEDIRISQDIINRLVESYRKVRNTARYILGNIDDFNPDEDMVDFEKLIDLDKYILIRWQAVKKRIYDAYKKYQFHTFYHAFLNFCISDLSNFYFAIIKDRLYSYKADSLMRRSAQTVLFTLAKEMSIVMAPVLSFTADEIWEFTPEYSGKCELVFQEIFPEVKDFSSANLEAKWARILEIRKDINKALENARAEKTIGHPLDAKVIVGLNEKDMEVMKADEGIEKIFVVSELEIKPLAEVAGHTSEDGQVRVAVTPSAHEKCERCWVRSETIGEDSEHPTICSRCAEAVK
ncbi:isoleucine--tRNA ligase [Limisalsivibrio acetivorans]|uniref:isoleucine--tRNA ligase n=1 Tax=Limisalsivibrio acetivorans TaxID=1304888 RepID=UPI0003B44DEA|nr:isoleucine--tRNA ligase [Limisalsivibrio acetivorans]